MRLETTILKALVKNEEFGRKVLPFLKKDYFVGTDSKLFDQISSHYLQYNGPPSTEVLSVDAQSSTKLTDGELKEIKESIAELKTPLDANTKLEWLLDKTEKFCQEKALYNAIAKSINVMDGKDKTLEKGAIPTLLSEALAVCFDPHVGHDYFDDAEARHAYYHSPVSKIPFDLEMLNTITKGGVSKKTLNVVMAGTGVGKSIFLCHLAAAYLAQGKNVLYISMEMREEELAKRIDANLFNLKIDDMLVLPMADYMRRIKAVRSRCATGNLKIKEFPTAGASVVHFEHVLNELHLKSGFKPDVILVDYLNIMMSSRIKSGTVNMYNYVKSITEEVRGLAVKYDVPIWSATQVNRTGFGDSDPEMDATSESFGLPMTVDLLLVLISSEALASLQQIMVKQLKNRYRDENKDRRFVLGLDKDKMQFSDADPDDAAQATGGQKQGNGIVYSETGQREELPWEEFKERRDKLAATQKAAEFKY
jgi:replicative DNA helicase